MDESTRRHPAGDAVTASSMALEASRNDVSELLDAVVSVAGGLDLATVLRRVVTAAKTLADCRYAALGVLGDDGALVEFLPEGLTHEEIEAIAEWPHGRGLLGLLLREPRVLRLEEIAAHPASFGFPAGHPPMRSFLGVPIRVRGAVFGSLYLTEKAGGRAFDDQDEALTRALAAAAGVAIENVRLYEATRARELWLEASVSLTRALLSGEGLDHALASAAERARRMAGAAAGAILLTGGRDQPDAAAASGLDSPDAAAELLHDDVVEDVRSRGEHRQVADWEQAGSSLLLAPSGVPGPALFVPSRGADGRSVVLAVFRRRGEDAFTGAEPELLEAYGDQVLVAIELAVARRDAERHGLNDDRERIARDLHDVVVQRLYGAALLLAGAEKLTEKPTVAERLGRAIDMLDDTIKDIRSTVFALESQGLAHGAGLRARTAVLVEEAGRELGFAPALRLEGLLDTDVPAGLEPDVLAALRECLSNVVRHAAARHVEVVVGLHEGELLVRVTDDGGAGRPDRGPGLGLRDLAARAARHGGRFALDAADGGGTVAVWRVPVVPGTTHEPAT
ncbi:GAF domain-containing sensor histidine kinase [Luteimicrobium sp. NPDC057192]|uniref:GAF domain-containing sensor histidine kinase n=1 Tax=Luteimicrobium sp. NPDC057192 TaxID=3346042 RepID=UPI0036438820